jgi:GMP synthase-like glutamine amidotransferase
MPPVLVIDFGSQVTQLIVRRVRESGVYCEVVPFNKADAALARETPRAIILSGGPASVCDLGSPRAPERVFKLECLCSAFCYGQQAMVTNWAAAWSHTANSAARDRGCGQSPLSKACGRSARAMWSG